MRVAVARTHHHERAFRLDPDYDYQQQIGAKPRGLWYAIDGDWERWCRAENYRPELLAVAHALSVDESRVLHVADAFELDAFHEKFAVDISPAGAGGWRHFHIDWRRVAEIYAGIEIHPYIWARRLEGPAHDWYYGWDCASGCVWDLSAVTKFKETT